MSEHESPVRAAPDHLPTPADIRALTGPATPHFALQIRNRVLRLVERLPAAHPTRAFAEREVARLERLADASGEFRGIGPHQDRDRA